MLVIVKQAQEIKIYFNKSVQLFSEKYNYQFETYEISGNNRISDSYIEKIVSKYYGNSIFMLPLIKISKKLQQDNWIKNIKLSIDYKNKLIINIEEYHPVGIYKFNGNLFYFTEKGKIIDKVDQDILQDKKLLIFSGKSSNIKASNLINLLKKLDYNFATKIKMIELINERRWNIKINNDVVLKLSEQSPHSSILNYLKLQENLSEVQMNNIKTFDLRNINKSVLVYN